MILMTHAANASKSAAERILSAGEAAHIKHVIDTTLVNAQASEFPITDQRYEHLASTVRSALGPEVQRVILSCSVYNAMADRLAGDLGLPVERSDRAGVEASVRETKARLGILVSFAPSAAVVESYTREVAGRAGRTISIEVAVASGSFAAADDLDAYASSLGAVVARFDRADTVFLSQFSMDPVADRLRQRFADITFVSALEETVATL